MNRKCLCIYVMLITTLTLMISCTSKNDLFSDKLWVKSTKVIVYEKPTRIAKQINTLKFGDQVNARVEKAAPTVPEEWVEIRLNPDVYGYIEKKNLADNVLMDKLKILMASVTDQQVQATGKLSKKSRLRIEPKRNTLIIESLKTPQNAEIFERLVSFLDPKEKKKKDVWYKVRLEEGQVGYVHTSNLSVSPPPELGQYTQSRSTVSWHVLQNRENKKVGKSKTEYIVSYKGIGLDIGADYNRIEVYVYNPTEGKYATAFAKSNLKGILPINVIEKDDGSKIFQIRELIKGKDNKLLVQEYSFPSPIKVVNKYEEDTVATIH